VISILTFVLIISALGRTEEQIRAEAALNSLLARHRQGQAGETSPAGRGRHSVARRGRHVP
jgi:hypothetical protein